MKVKGLIKKLQELNEDMEIGYYDASRDEVLDILSIEKISKNTNFEKDFKSDLYLI